MRYFGNPLFSACILIGVAGLIMILSIWNIGIMHTDDAGWYLEWLQGKDPAIEWAVSQGRVYALIVGELMLHALSHSGSTYSELLKTGSFAAAIFLYGVVIAVYFSVRLGVLSVAIFVAFSALKLDGSATVTYPLLIWPSVISLCLSLLVARSYAKRGGLALLFLHAVLLFFSMFTNEGVTLLVMVASGLGCIANIAEISKNASGNRSLSLSSGRARATAITVSVVPALYVGLYVWFLRIHPSSYDGSFLTATRPLDSLETLVFFTFGGSILFSLFSAYHVTFSEPALFTGVSKFYKISDSFTLSSHHVLAVGFGVLCATAVGFALNVDNRLRRPISTVSEVFALLCGIITAILPILPVALSVKYIDWHTQLGVDSYVTTVVSHFGVSLSLSAICLCLDRYFGSWKHMEGLFRSLLITAIFVLSFANQAVNERISSDIRLEGLRWNVFDRAIRLTSNTGVDGTLWLLPQFDRGSWYTVVPKSYWSKLAAAKFRRNISLSDSPLDPNDVSKAVLISYVAAEGHRSAAVIAAALHVDNSGLAAINKIAIDFDGSEKQTVSQAVLSFDDTIVGPRHLLLSGLKKVSGAKNEFVLEDVSAVPGTVHLSEQADSINVPLFCEKPISVNTWVQFGVTADIVKGTCAGNVFLNTGWGSPEVGGIWSLGDVASLTLPVKGIPRGAKLSFSLETLTSLGFTFEPQTVTVFVNGAKLASWSFERGGASTDREFSIELPVNPEETSLAINLSVDAPISLAKQGVSGDNRLLGIHLKSVRFLVVTPE